jgi:outer membrane protein assembly factor BamB
VLWKHATGAAVVSSPAVAEGVVYIGSLDHTVYALKA